MKAYFITSLCLLLATAARGQNFDEWFRQRQTKEKYLVQQIAALQAYSGTLRQGYEIARQGISTVQQIRNGDLGLHQVFFRSLESVNPRLLDTPPVHAVMHYQEAILQAFAAKEPLLRQGTLTATEQAYLQQVKKSILAACQQDLEKLWLILTTDKLHMEDNSRLKELQALRRQSHTTYQFTRSFLEQVHLLALRRWKESRELEKVRFLLNIP